MVDGSGVVVAEKIDRVVSGRKSNQTPRWVRWDS